MDMKSWKQKLHDPGAEFRSAPFWAFNSRFDNENLRFQITEMKKAGMGGFFIHSREGLETPYLSEEWMDAVDCCITEAEAQNMEVWIYDEDKWPSGSTGGLVSRENPMEYTAKGITLEVLQPEEARARIIDGDLRLGKEYEDGKIIGIYCVELKGNAILSMSRDMKAVLACPECGDKAAASGRTGEETFTEQETVQRILVLRREVSGNSEWYNGFAPSDMLNPEAVQIFLNQTHEKYKARFGTKFGKQIKGFFTDEPNCCDFFSLFTHGRPWLTYTDALPSYFFKKRGYFLWDTLPYLFFDGPGAAKLRHDYWRTIAELFQESYMKQIYDWCNENQVELTGHMLYENDLGYQARVCGSAMAQYKYFHRPGVDLLGEQTKEYLTMKQASSVAHQYGRKHMITETYGCTGWEFTFEGQKWLGDWQFVMGIDRRCQHLAQYSITGCRKRDYPPVFSYQTTWWQHNHLLEDYFARISMVLGKSEVIRDVLVLHPMSSIWTGTCSRQDENLDHMEMNMGWLDEHITRLNQWGEEYNRLAQMLLGIHVDFDFGDEILMEQDGEVRDGKFVLGDCSYSTVIVPRVLTIFNNTKRLLEEFASAGGRIIFTAPLPTMIEGTVDPGLKETLYNLPGSQIVGDYEELLQLLQQDKNHYQIRSRYGLEDPMVLASLRKTTSGKVLYLINNDRENTHEIKITLPEKGKIELYDPWSDQWSIPEIESGEKTSCLIELTPSGSRLLFVNEKDLQTDTVDQPGALEYAYVHPHYADPVFAALGPVAQVQRTMENVLTLDVCSYRLGEEAFSEPMQVWQAQQKIRDRLQMQQVYYNGAPQRYFWLNKPCAGDGTPFCLSFDFESAEEIEGVCYAVIEKPEEYQVTLDGESCILTTDYYLDRDMKKLQMPKLCAGRHTLQISGLYKQKYELEDIYIVGEFDVDKSRRIRKTCGVLHFGDWCLQGNYHYPGSIIYRFSLPGKEEGSHRYRMKMGDYRAAFGIVYLNGQEAGYLMGNTLKDIELTPWMKEDSNLLEIELIGSPRNMFGPFHQTYTGCSRISWADFRTEGRFFTPDYVLEPYGLMGQITICKMKI